MLLPKGLSDSDLLAIMRVYKLHGLYDALGQNKAGFVFEQIQGQSKARYIRNKRLQAMLVPLANASSYPLFILLSIVGLVSVGTLPLMIGTIVFGILSLLFASFFFYSSYKELQRKEKKMNRMFLLHELKSQAADDYLNRHGIQISISEVPSYANKKKLFLLKEALSSSILTTATLFGTHFLGLNGILVALKLTVIVSLTMSPIGILIGLAVAIGLGVIVGIKRYHIMKQEDRIEFEQKCLMVLVAKKISICDSLNTRKIVEVEELTHDGATSMTRPLFTARENNKFVFNLKGNQSQFFLALRSLEVDDGEHEHADQSNDLVGQVSSFPPLSF